MNNELPEMYRGNIDSDISNNSYMYSSLDRTFNNNINNISKKYSKYEIENKINNIFNSKDVIYKANVIIVTDNDKYSKKIIGKTKDNLITIDNEYIDINTIRDIYKK